MTDVTAAIQAAKAAAAQMVQEEKDTAIVAHVSGGVATPMMKPSMAMAMASSSLIPKTAPYLKVNEFGLLIGKTDKKFKESFKARLLLQEDRGFQLKWTLRYGNPAQYLSTYDGLVCDKGGSWADAQAKVRAIDPKAEPYISADILVELAEDVEVTGSKIDSGTKLAINLSKTNFSEWQDFFTAASEAGVMGQEVDVTIGFRDVHWNGNDWGVITFTLA